MTRRVRTAVGDVWTVLGKEWRELTSGDARWVTVSTLAVFLGIIGVLLPWQLGAAWLTAPWAMAIWAWIPFFLVTTVAADAVAGERERHTLETLLATRLPDRALLLGKLLGPVTWVWTATMACVPFGLLTLGVTLSTPLPATSPGHWLAVGGLVFASALFGGSLSLLVSMRADSVRQAQQTLALGSLALFLLPVIALRLLPDALLSRLLETLALGSPSRLALWVSGVLLLATLPAFGLLLVRFRRRRLLS